MPSQITNYQCPACTGPLHYSGSTGRLECEYCGSSFDVAEIEKLYAQKDAAAAAAMEKEQAAPGEAPKADTQSEEDAEPQWVDTGSEDDVPDDGAFSTDWGADAEKMRAYTCPSCGAELICEETTAATSCPYCGNPTIIPGKFAGALRPEFVLPFRLDKQSAIRALKQHYRGNPFLPRVFSAENHIEEIKGVYVPFWLFDETVTGDARFAARRVRVRREGDYEVTSIDHFAVHRSGTASFTRIPADGSKKMPDDYMDSLEPFDYNELKAFSTAYLPGYLADRYDVSAKECAARADRRCVASTAELLERDVVGYSSINLVEMQSKVQHGNVHYALLPVWLLNTKWNGKNYLYAMNGQTGKFVGELPVSGKRVWTATLLLTALLTGLFYFTGIARWLLELFL